MGIDYNGGMIVGCEGDKIDCHDDHIGWACDHDMVCMSQFYDAGKENQYIGFFVQDIKVDNIDLLWLDSIRLLAIKFKELTGQDAILIGTQDIN